MKSPINEKKEIFEIKTLLFAAIVSTGLILFLWACQFLIPPSLSTEQLVYRVILFWGSLATITSLITWITLHIGPTRIVSKNLHEVSEKVGNFEKTLLNNTKSLSEKLETFGEKIQTLLEEELPFLIPVTEMMRLEFEDTKSVWIFSRALDLDLTYYKEIYKNMTRGVEYTYIVPRGKAEQQYEELKKRLIELARNENKNPDVIVKQINNRVLPPHSTLATIIIHNPLEVNRRVFIKIPSDLGVEDYPLALQILPKHPHAIETIIDGVADLIRNGCPRIKQG